MTIGLAVYFSMIGWKLQLSFEWRFECRAKIRHAEAAVNIQATFIFFNDSAVSKYHGLDSGVLFSFQLFLRGKCRFPLWASEEMNALKVWKVYLITYSQVNKDRFPTRMSFVEAVRQSFASTLANVIQWCSAEEQHVSAWVHYHMVIKLDRNQRWISIERFLLESCGNSVNFYEMHNNYYSAWK